MVETSLCGRVGCGEPATCVLLMAPQDTQAWLVSPQHDAAPDGVALCESHADRISVPFGWALADERTPAKPTRKRAKKTAASPKKAESKKAKPRKAETPAKAKGRVESRPKPSFEPEPSGVADEKATIANEPVIGGDEAVVEVGIVDEPTIQLPAVHIDHPSSPSEIPMNADGLAAAVAEETPRLSVVPGDDDPDRTFDFDSEGQGALWADRPEPEHEPDESTPLLKRAFRVVRDE